MALKSGTYTVGPENGTLLLRTGREGAAARMGHDLVIVATKWKATVTVDADDPARSTLTASVDARSLSVREGSGGAKALSDKDKADIEKTTREKILQADKNPEITFQSSGVTGSATAATVTGTLTVAGTARPATLAVASDGESKVTATLSIVQSDFGIKPYSALLGSLKVKDTVQLSVEVQVPA